MDLPPVAAAVCPAASAVTEAEAAAILATMRGKLPRTAIKAARPAVVCGLIELQLENGNVAYTDKSGRYFIMGLMVDTATGRFVSHPSPNTDSQELSQ